MSRPTAELLKFSILNFATSILHIIKSAQEKTCALGQTKSNFWEKIQNSEQKNQKNRKK